MTDSDSKTRQAPGRQAERHSCRLKARYRILYAVPSMAVYRRRDTYEEGWLLNRSDGGVLLETAHHISEGRNIEVNYHSPDGRNTYRAQALVCWVRKQSESVFHVGLHYHTLETL